MRLFPLLLFVAALASTRASARTWYVTPDGTGDAPTIQAGVDSAAAGDEVLLACGTFHETEIRLKSRVTLRGTSMECTVLQGAGGATTLRCEDAEGVRVQDLRLVGGDFRMRVARSSPVELVRCVFHGGDANPAAGRALDCESSTIALTGCRFSGNAAQSDTVASGAGMRSVSSNVSLESCIFENNSASGQFAARGAGLYGVSSTIDLRGCLFADNTAGDPASGSGYGAAVRAEMSGLTVLGCTFSGNTVRGAFARAGGIAVATSAGVVVRECTFLGNRARHGAGVAMDVCTDTEIRDCTFRGNTGEQGAAIFANRSVALVESCLFHENTAQFMGNAARGSPITVVFAGYGGPPPATVLTLRRCTWFGTLGLGTGVFAYSGGTANLENCIVAGGAGPAAECFYGDLNLTCCDVWGNAGGDWVDCIADQLGTGGNITADPIFCDPAAGNFKLAAISPCAPEGSMGCGQIGAYGVGCGAVPVERSSFGRVKAFFR